MTVKASVNFQPIKDNSEHHFDVDNRRNNLDYVFNDRIELNQSYIYPQLEGMTVNEYKEDLKALVKEKTGRTMQSKASPIKEGVINLKEDTTMSDIQRFAQKLQEKFKIIPLRIEIHEDEGYENGISGEIKYNRHAHFIVDWMNHENGKSLKLDAFDTRKIQDILAEELKMERGDRVDCDVIETKGDDGRIKKKNVRKSNKGKKHISAIDFKDQKEVEKREKLRETVVEYKNQNILQKLGSKKMDIKKTSENILDLLDAFDDLGHQLDEKVATIEEKEAQIKGLQIDLKAKQNKINELNDSVENKDLEIGQLTIDKNQTTGFLQKWKKAVDTLGMRDEVEKTIRDNMKKGKNKGASI